MPASCTDADGDRDGDGRVDTRDLVNERDCLDHRDGVLEELLKGWQRWWKGQGADENGTGQRIG